MSATTHATRAAALTDIVRRARRSGIVVTFDHDGIVVLQNPQDAEAPQAQPTTDTAQPAAAQQPAAAAP